jgi:hypothetical protein
MIVSLRPLLAGEPDELTIPFVDGGGPGVLGVRIGDGRLGLAEGYGWQRRHVELGRCSQQRSAGKLGATSGGTAGGEAGGSSGGSQCTRCPSTCCDAGASCVDDGSGNLSCKKDCSTNSQCPSSNPCCVLLKNGAGVCGGSSSDVLCRCTTGAECSSKACAPNIDTNGNPVGPYVCVQDDGAPYHGCSGLLTSLRVRLLFHGQERQPVLRRRVPKR